MMGRAKIRVNERALVEFLQLPHGLRVRAIDVSNDPPSINVIVESELLPEVPIDAEAPYVYVRWTQEVNEHGATVRQFEYQWPEGAAL